MPNGPLGFATTERVGHEQLVELVRQINSVVPLNKIRLTGGEPLLFPRLPLLVEQVRRLLPNAFFALTTNGTLLGPMAADLRNAGLDAINVSLDHPDPTGFTRLTGGGKLEKVETGLQAARKAKFANLKLNSVLLRTHNGERLPDLVRLAERHGCEIRFIELMPMGPASGIFDTEFLSVAEALKRLTQEFPIVEPLDPTGTAHRYRLRDHQGSDVVVGFISSVSLPFCDSCDRIRLDSHGRLFSCLKKPTGIDLLTPLKEGDDRKLKRRIDDVIVSKHERRSGWPSRSMAAIGG